MTSLLRWGRIRTPDTYDDTLTAAQVFGVEGTAVDSEDFLAGLLSQIKRMVGSDHWYSKVNDVASDPRTLKALTDDVYYKRTFRWRQIDANIAVGGGNSYVVLSQASSQTPSETAAVGSGSANGAIVAGLSGDVGSWDAAAVTGLTGVFPKNLCLVREASTQDPILSDQRQVYALLQAESGVIDGDAFNDTTKQCQLSFVRQTSAGTALEQCQLADIGGKTINYQYQSRANLKDRNEQDWITQVWMDSQSAAAITLQNAYISGNSIAVSTSEGNLVVNLSEDGTDFEVQRGGAAFLTLTRNDSSGDELQLDADILDVNLTQDADFSEGVKIDTAGTTINIGVTAGRIDATGLKAEATSGNLDLVASGELRFDDSRETSPLPLSDASAGKISALPGGPYASVSAAIRSALLSAHMDIFLQTLTSNYAQDVNVPGSGNGDAQDWTPAFSLATRSIDMNTPSGVDTLIILNGRILRGGNGTTNNDVYAGTTPANGDLKYDYVRGVKTGDQLIAISWYAA
jgi:hypothetical protein